METKPLKPYRSKAERTAVKQRWLAIGFTGLNTCLAIAILVWK